MLYATDTVSLGDVRVNDAGYLEAFARTARTGVQQYLGAEVERPDLAVVNVYRDAADVFSHASLHSFAKVPVTVDHPPGGVNAQNWKQHAVGTTGEEVLRDGERLKIGLKIMDRTAIEAVQAGKRELSVGYRCKLEWGDGVTADGTPYQAKQVGIVADHIAIVARGRAGAQCRIGDAWPSLTDGAAREPGGNDPRTPIHQDRKVSMKTLTIDGHSVELSDAAVIAVSALQKQLGTAVTDNLAKDKAMNDAATAHDAAIKAKDAELADAKKAGETKDGEILALKKQVADAALTPQKLDAAVTSRLKVVSDARRIAGDTLVVDGKTEAEIKRAAVAAHLGDAAKDISDEAISGAFLSFANKLPNDPLRNALQDGVPGGGRHQTGNVIQLGDAATEYGRMLEHDRTAWQIKKEA